jgi:hypothetical protein
MSKIFDKYTKRLKNVDNVLFSIGDDIKGGIKKRTRSGKDVNLSSFKPYEANYKKTGVVNLTITGKMLNSILFKRIRNGVRFYFPNRENAKAYSNQQKRKFFGVDRVQIKDVKKRMLKSITKQ